MRRIALLVVALLATLPAGAAAHPLGNFTVNQYARVEIAPTGVHVLFVLDQAEIPTFQLVQRFDGDDSGAIDGSEVAAARSALIAEVVPHLELHADGRPVQMVPGAATLTFPAGQGGLHTSRLELRLAVVGVALSNRPVRLTYETTFAIDRVGWREIVVVRAVGSAITATTASTSDRTDALHSYPADLLASPLDQRTATIDARIGDGGIRLAGLDTEGNVAAGVAGKDASGFAGLLDEHRRLSLGVVLGSLLVALGFGMLHALSPGHGKSMVAAYLAGTRGTARHAFALGATVTIAHTSSVFALGLVTLTLSELIVPDRLYPWLDLTSGVMVLTLGAIAIRGRLRWRSRQVPHAVARQHEHGHSHDPAGHGHSHGTADPAGLSWRSLIALGVSGGLIPCPSALVVLLSAIAAHRLAFGMVLIVAFSFGLAAVISGVGLAVLYARRLFARVPSGGRLLALLPVASAVAITILGLVLTVRALPRLV